MSEKDEQPEEETPEPELISVRVLGEKGATYLVELEGPRRCYVPKRMVKDKQIEASVLDKALDYGIRWEAFLETPDVSPEALAIALRRAGIWTLDDLKARDRQLIRIGTNIIGKAVLKAAQRAEKNKLPRRKRHGK